MIRSGFLIPFILVVNLVALAYEPQLLSTTSTAKPAEMEGVGITEKLGNTLDLNLRVRDEEGQERSLKEILGQKPALLSLVYYSCPGLCNYHLNGLTDALKDLKWTVGEEFQVLALSFDPSEKSPLAAEKKKSYLKVYDRGRASGWHFLTADIATVAAVTQQVGFGYKWNKEANEWAHASAAIVLTSEGKISRYIHGVAPQTETIKLALSEASQGRIGSIVDTLNWLCMKWDPKLNKFTVYGFRLVQIGGGLIVLFLLFLILSNYLKQMRRPTGGDFHP